MQSNEPVIEPVESKNRTPLILAISAIILLCCCLALGITGYFTYITMQTSQTESPPLEEVTPEIFEPDAVPTDTFEVPSTDLGIGDAPTGGLGNDILRNDTWQYVAFAAMGQGCDQPIGADTQIEVLQEPQNGVWVEKWTVGCASGETYPYEVEFILDDTGATFNIKSLP